MCATVMAWALAELRVYATGQAIAASDPDDLLVDPTFHDEYLARGSRDG
jgi:hypothetical protein